MGPTADSEVMHTRSRLLPALLTTIAALAALVPAASAAAPRTAYVSNINGGGVFPFDAFTGVFGTPIAVGGGFLWGVAITPDGATAYVVNESANHVVPVDTTTATPGTPIPVGNSPRLIGITPDGSRAYVANIGSGTVTPIDLATHTAGRAIAVGTSPHGVAIAPDGSRVYVANLNSNSVSVIDTATDAVVATIPVGRPYTLAIAPDGATVYVTDINSPNVYAIDTATNTVLTTIPVGADNFGIAVSPDGETVWVSRTYANSIVPIDTATNTAGAPLTIGSQPEGIAITPDGGTAYVTDIGADVVWPLDLSSETVGAPRAVGQDPTIIAITPNRAPGAAFGTSLDDHEVTLDAGASSDPDGSVVEYAWDFGDGQTATGAQQVVRHTYAQPGSYTVTLTVTDDEGCSEALVYTGQTASCTGSPDATVVHSVTVAAPPASPAVLLPPSPVVALPPALRQAIERFTLDGPCVRRARDGEARIGLRLRLALPGAVSIRIDRALTAVNRERCPSRNPNRSFAGRLRRVAALDDVPTQAVAAAVQRRVTRSFELPPGLYRIGVRAHGPDGRLTRSAYRWVRVLGRPH